jgi:cytochrome c oxidase subunit 2
MVRIGAGAAAAVALPACGVQSSTVQPAASGPVSGGAWGAAVIFGALVVLVIVVLFALALRRRDREAPRFVSGNGLVAVGGLAVPVAVVAALSVVAGLQEARAGQQAQAPVPIQVSAHQWWWGITYRNTGVVTADQLTVPAGRPVDLTLTSDNVEHAFWVPPLIPPTDVVPGTVQHVTLTAETPGTYRGQCAQFCGLGHADMRIVVVVVSQTAFDGWQHREVTSAQRNATAGVPAGFGVFLVAGCDRCHTIAGTIADGTVGPDLTDVGSREMLGANVIHNDPGSLARWIADPSSIKPGVKMPGYAGTLSPAQIGTLVRYLEGLR